MLLDFGAVLDGVIGEGGLLSKDAVAELSDGYLRETSSDIESTFGPKGFYDRSAAPYAPPTVPFESPPDPAAPVIDAVRRLWLVRFKPGEAGFRWTDIDDHTRFPWSQPELAPRLGWWASTVDRPASRSSLEEITSGDLVVCQRTDPAGAKAGGTRGNPLVGITVVGMTRSWLDAHTGRRERDVCLVPLTRFDHEVPRATARSAGRLKRPSFSQPRQLPGGVGQPGRFLSAVDLEDAVELLSVCGVPPEALAEPDTAVLAARLRATATGNAEFLQRRYDAVFRNSIARAHERDAERRAQTWAARRDYLLLDLYQRLPLTGFDLVFANSTCEYLEVEVKGYSTDKLHQVHLQNAQVWRAHEAAQGAPPEWRLFVVLNAEAAPSEQVLEPATVVQLVASKGLDVGPDWAARRPAGYRTGVRYPAKPSP